MESARSAAFGVATYSTPSVSIYINFITGVCNMCNHVCYQVMQPEQKYNIHSYMHTQTMFSGRSLVLYIAYLVFVKR